MKKIKKGFTLVELLIVIAIISLLTGIVVANMSSARSKARDAKRISDMGQIQLAIELFFDRCKFYPYHDASDAIDFSSSCTVSSDDVFLSDYISKIPQPSPAPGQPIGYEYYVDDSGNPTDYVLKAVLESYNEVLKDGLKDGELPTGHWFRDRYSGECDNSSPSGRDYCLSPK